MKCHVCGAPTERDGLCFECKRDEIQREREQLQVIREEEFYRTLFKDQLANQRKIAEEQTRDLDFHEVRRTMLELELLAQDNPTAAKKKAHAFFDSAPFRDHSGKLLDSIVASEFLLECYGEHELRLLCGPRGSFEEIDWFLDFYSTIHSSSLKKAYAKLVALVEACDPTTAGLRPELVDRIKTYPARCREKQEREEQEKRRKWEEFLQGYEEMCRFAQSSPPRKLSGLESFQRWWRWNFPLTAVQRQAHDRRQGTINALAEWVEEGLRDFHADGGSRYATREIAIIAKLWFESRFDRRLITLVLVHLLHQPWRDPRSALVAAVNEFQHEES